MNVVLEQLRLKHKVPKDIMHYIVHMFRPRAPPFTQKKWDSWSPDESRFGLDVQKWYSWRLFSGYNSPNSLWSRFSDGVIRPCCSYCTKAAYNDHTGVCSECQRAFGSMHQQYIKENHLF